MFEKEAKRSFDELDDRGIGEDWSIEESYVNGFQNGAEFGYNKANEWHYVKDGDYPKDETEKEYLVALKSEYSGFYYEIDIWCKSLHCFASNNPIKVYAWKEIVLPKESE